MFASSLWAEPEPKEVKAGRADFSSPHAGHLRVETSDKAIINYHKFNILENESVAFVQPSSKSCVLNRVVGNDPSKILGKLQANGRFFLINPQGIYFGKNATVNTGSLIASTLNILDEDFLQEKYCFFQESGSQNASITNEGSIFAEGSIALFSPLINNKGSLIAHADKVVLASAEKVVLDFTGDGLIRFSVEGDLKNALIENYGEIQAANGSVELSLKAAEKAIKTVVNTDGITPASALEEIGGVIHLVSRSQIAAKQIFINGGDGSKVNVEGLIDASNANAGEKGGIVHVLGDHVLLQGAQINASGDAGGGEVLIGGGFQGKEPFHNAKTTWVDENSEIYADARNSGNGGKVIVWSDSTTVFDGSISVRGGVEWGNGGFVETSGKVNLGIAKGRVVTSASEGQRGEWLLDPTSVTIVASGGTATLANVSAPNCFDATTWSINASVFTVLTNTAVSICATNSTSSKIFINTPIAMGSGSSLTLTASANTGAITLCGAGGGGITTQGQPITLNGSIVLGSAAVVLDTTNSGASPNGANITYNGTLDGNHTHTMNAGTTGTIAFLGNVGGLTIPPAGVNLIFNGAGLIQIGANIIAKGADPLTFPSPVSITTTSNITSYNSAYTGQNITFSSTLNGAQALTLDAGTGTVAFNGAVGNTAPLTNLTFTNAALIQVGSNITMSGANTLTFPDPVSITGTSNITSNNANISFGSTLDGAQALTITGGSGTTTFTGAVGGTTPLSSLSATAATITQSSTVKTTGAVSYTGSIAIHVNGNITTSTAATGTVTMTGPVTLAAGVVIDTTNGGGTAAGSNINFSGGTTTINGAFALGLNGGTGGTVTLGGVAGGTTPLSTLTVTNAATININSIGGASAGVSGATALTSLGAINFNGLTYNANAQTYTAATNFQLSSGVTTFTTNNNALTFTTGTIQVPAASTFTASSGTGTITVGPINGAATSSIATLTNTTTGITVLRGTISIGTLNFSATTGQIQLQNTISVTTTNSSISFPAGRAVLLNNSPAATATSVTISPSSGFSATFNSTIDSDGTANTRNLTVTTAGAGTITFGGAVGATTAITSLSATSATINVNSIGAASAGVSGATALTSLGAINFNGLTYNANAQTYTAATNFQLSSGVTTFTTNNNALTFTTGTIQVPAASTFTASSGTGTITVGPINGAATSSIATLTNTTTGITVLRGTISIGTLNFSATTGQIQLQNTIAVTTTNSSISFPAGRVVLLNNSPTATATSVTISPSSGFSATFNSTIDSDGTANTRNLTVTTAGAGTITFGGAVGATTAITSLSATSAASTVTQSSTVKTTGAVSYSGTGISLGGNITTSTATSGTVTMTGPITLAAGVVIDTTNGGGTAAGSNINFSGSSTTINGAFALGLTSGTAGTITLGGAVGASTPIASLTANSGTTVTQSSTVKTTGAVSYSGTGISLGGNITTSTATSGTVTMTGPVTLAAGVVIDTTNGGGTAAGSNINFSGSSTTINGAFALGLTGGTAGTITLGGAVGGITPLASLTANSGTTLTQSSTVKTTGAVSYTGNGISLGGNITTSTATSGTVTMTGPVTLAAGVAIDTTNGGGTAAGSNINFSGSSTTINGAFALGLTSGTAGTITLGGAVGGSTPIASLTANSGTTLTQSSSVKTTGAMSYTGNGISLGGNITTSTAATGTVTMTGPVTLAAGVVIDTTNGGGTAAGSNINFSGSSTTINGAFALGLNGGTGGTVTLGGVVGGSSALSTLTVTNAATINVNSIGAASAGVSGATALTSLGAINFNGLTYNANAQTYTAATNFQLKQYVALPLPHLFIHRIAIRPWPEGVIWSVSTAWPTWPSRSRSS